MSKVKPGRNRGISKRRRIRRALTEPLESRFLLSRTIYVDIHAPGIVKDGTSWATAYTNLLAARNAASSGDQVRVAQGMYRFGDRTASFQLKSGVALYGGYAGNTAIDPSARDSSQFPTILSGDIGIPGDNSDNTYHVVTASGVNSSAVLDGFTIEDGNATDSSGGGIMITNASPTIRNCTFIGNHAESISRGTRGGAAYSLNSSPTFQGCTFTDNSATGGGAVYDDSSTATFEGCTFLGNSADPVYGAVYDYRMPCHYSDCIFSANSGGALVVSVDPGSVDPPSPETLTRCQFIGNNSGAGGAIRFEGWTPGIVVSCDDCTFIGNTAYIGGAIDNTDFESPILLTNCSIVDNSAVQTGGAFENSLSQSIFSNCVIWGNTASTGGQIYQEDPRGTTTVQYTDIQGGYAGTGNINADPLFVRNPNPGADNTWGTPDDDYGDLRLQSASPCLNTGSNAAIPAGITADLEGNARIVSGTVDMGAYERQVVLSTSSSSFSTDGAAGPSLVVQFSNALDPSSLSPSDLLVQQVLPGGSLGASFPVSSVSYDPASKSATFTLPVSTPDGNYRATLLAGSVSDTYGNVPASDYSFDFFVLGGDANHDRVIDIRDLYALATNYGGTGKTFSQGDFNYDGIVDGADLSILASHWQQSLATPSAPLASSVIQSARRIATRVVTLLD